MPSFQRGDVFNAYVPKIPSSQFPQQSPPPSYILEGLHKFVVLHDSNDREMPSKSVVAVPITSIKTSVARDQIRPSYVPLDKARHSFLDHDSYISTHQPMPLSRNWLSEKPLGKIDPVKMTEVDLQMIRTTGLESTVQQLIQAKIREQAKAFEKGMEQAAASREKGYER